MSEPATLGAKSSVRRWGLTVVAVTLAVRLIYLTVLTEDSMCDDLHAWRDVGEILLRGGNPYSETEIVKWAPFWVQWLYLIAHIADWTGLTFLLVLRLVFVLFECVCALLLLLIADRQFGERGGAWVLIAISLDPICVFHSIQHGNFDALVSIWVLLFLYSLLEFHREGGGRVESWLLACLFCGMGIVTKTVPLVLAPLLFYRASSLSREARLLGIVLLLGPTTLGMSVLFTIEPEGAMGILSYRSASGFFGITGILTLLDLAGWVTAYTAVYPWLMIGFLGVASYRLAKLQRALSGPHLVLACALLLLGVVVLGTGYAPQYVYWFLPLLALLCARKDFGWRPYLLPLFGIAVVTYTVEYALLISHGAFLLHLWRPPWLDTFAEQLGTKTGQTLLRLPLFLAYAVFFVQGCRRLAPALRSGED